MSLGSKIEWTDATWNPVRGCTKISPGCKHYATRRLPGRQVTEAAACTKVLFWKNFCKSKTVLRVLTGSISPDCSVFGKLTLFRTLEIGKAATVRNSAEIATGRAKFKLTRRLISATAVLLAGIAVEPAAAGPSSVASMKPTAAAPLIRATEICAL